MELAEVSQVLDVSKEQYEEILSIVQRHTDESVDWLSNMAAQFGWVARAGVDSTAPGKVFLITAVRGVIVLDVVRCLRILKSWGNS